MFFFVALPKCAGEELLSKMYSLGNACEVGEPIPPIETQHQGPKSDRSPHNPTIRLCYVAFAHLRVTSLRSHPRRGLAWISVSFEIGQRSWTEP